ncbi:ribose-phosphate diphosphokinase [Allomyces macrogynus ATCC 38327]|uniref:Ribose-phosphate diphosphokinase n=1 Tax=Allomyces macrogynus (strain ATCC 38327) TaxID=578462 RepID=A0A0L0T977_ALLM3|nr:ribose-phosphate diphosphokinase [Allomyces macrogynus ATCC 38327]|eukprot:KNE71271.1 ribose-phosphate diphosphokinase [Allomyces macrogynus ATCC 38327]
MVLSTGGGKVHGYTLDTTIGEFILTHPDLRMAGAELIYSINEGNSVYWDDACVEYFGALKNRTVEGKPAPATAIADALNMNFALIHKDRRHATSTLTLVGNVKDRVVIMIDDIADTCHTLARAAHVLTRNGAAKVYALVTHGIMSGDAIDRLVRSPIDTLIVSNTVPQVEHVKAAAAACGRPDKIKVFDVAPILAEAVRRIHNGESVSFLFDIVPIVN